MAYQFGLLMHCVLLDRGWDFSMYISNSDIIAQVGTCVCDDVGLQALIAK